MKCTHEQCQNMYCYYITIHSQQRRYSISPSFSTYLLQKGKILNYSIQFNLKTSILYVICSFKVQTCRVCPCYLLCVYCARLQFLFKVAFARYMFRVNHIYCVHSKTFHLCKCTLCKIYKLIIQFRRKNKNRKKNYYLLIKRNSDVNDVIYIILLLRIIHLYIRFYIQCARAYYYHVLLDQDISQQLVYGKVPSIVSIIGT